MSEIDQGGFVYPSGQKVLGYDDILPARSGITLRQHYAGIAMQAIIALEGVNSTFEGDLVDAKTAYRYADAMIEAGKQ